MSELYSIIQFCPSALRREGVNVGVVVLSERFGAVRVKMSSNNELVRKHYGSASFDDAWLSSAKRSLGRRLQGMDPTEVSLFEFIAKEAGQLTVLPPQPLVVEDPDRTVQIVFDQVVGEIEGKHRRRERAPALEDVFMPLFAGRLVEKVPAVTVPVSGKKIRGAYKYRNGSLNYVKPQGFAANDDAALTAAGNLGVAGLMLAKYPLHDDEEIVQQKLIVVARVARLALVDRIKTVLRDCSVRLVMAEDVASFVDEVRSTAHPLH